MFKNIGSQKIAFFAFDTTTGAAKTGDAANLTAYQFRDWAALITLLADTSATEMDSTHAPGWYVFDLTSTETSADVILFTCVSTSANVAVVGQLIYTVDYKAAADALLDRDMSLGTDSGSPTVRTVRQALRFLRNKWNVASGTLTVKKEDDTTTSWTASVSATAGADPVTGVDPA